MNEYDNITNQIRMILDQKRKNGIQEIVYLLQQNIKHYSWVGIYILQGSMLHLGPWAGPNATEHTKIPLGEGICGSAVKTGKTEVISDVQSDKRYLSCFLSTKSEIVVPIKYNQKIIGEIDIDSDQLDAFTKDDELFLETIADILGPFIHKC